FPLGCVNARLENCGSNSFGAQKSLQTCRDIVFLRVHSEHLTPSSFGAFFPDLLDQLPFLGVQLFLRQVPSLRNDESNIALQFCIELGALQGPKSIGMVRI